MVSAIPAEATSTICALGRLCAHPAKSVTDMAPEQHTDDGFTWRVVVKSADTTSTDISITQPGNGYVIKWSQEELNSMSKPLDPVDKDKRKAFKKFINPEPWKRR